MAGNLVPRCSSCASRVLFSGIVLFLAVARVAAQLEGLPGENIGPEPVVRGTVRDGNPDNGRFYPPWS